MERYKNLGGNSSVVSYEIGSDFIIVIFQDDLVYTYNYVKPGITKVEAMKKLAIVGQGLNSYIKKNVGSNYASKS